MDEITNTLELPNSAICYVRTDWPDGSSTRASGVVVGINDVLTALHVVYDESRGGWAKDVIVYPGTDTVPALTAPFGVFTDFGSIVGRAANWDLDGDGLLTAEESQGDLALVGFKSPIGDTTGWLPVTDMPSSFWGEIAGYPARGTGLMGETDLATASTDFGVYSIDSGLGAGASGGPLLYTSGGVTSVAGVLSSGNGAETVSTYAALFGSGTWAWLQGAIAANDTLIGYAPGTAPETSPNIFMGTVAADAYVGTAGRDIFTGLAGNDSFDGSAGLDIAI
jgi:V8-like Glu-specific endopeptidase